MTPKTKSARRNFRLLAILLSGSALAGGTLAAYADSTWTGATSTDWFTATNWTPNAVPTSTDNTLIDNTANNPVLSATGATNALTVGKSGTAALDVTGAGVVLSTQTVTLGLLTGSSGSLTVENGASLALSNSSELNVGASGAGSLIVRTGGQLTNPLTIVTFGGGGGGTGLVDGAGSSLLASDIMVGNDGVGTLTIQNGATVTTISTEIANGASGGTGTVTVTGTGSGLTASEIVVAAAGTGNLTVQNGATVTASTSLIVGGPNTLSPATVAMLTIASGGAVTVNGSAAVGQGTLAGSSAAVSVDGGSVLEVMNTLDIGDQGGTGAITVTNGSLVFAQTAHLGNTAGSTGMVTVDGVNSAFTSNTEADIGNFGTGTMIVRNGGGLGGGQILVAAQAGSNGTLTITDIGSIATVQTIAVGVGGVGKFSLLNGATASDNAGVIGLLAGGNGTVVVDRANWTNNQTLDMGYVAGSTGTLTISDNGAVTNGLTNVGIMTGATATITVTGTGSSMASTDAMLIGIGGSGTLNIINGATVGALFTTTVGQGDGSSGLIAIDGAGSALNTSANIFIGGDTTTPSSTGVGAITVTNGGAINDFSSLEIGFATGSTGSLTVDGNGSAVTTVNLQVGENGTGNVTVSNGGALSSPIVLIGSGVAGTGSATVTGAGSILTGNTIFYVGSSGIGSLTLADGGTAASTSGIVIANDPSATGSLNIGAASGSAAAAPGIVAASTVTFGAGVGSLNFNHTGTAYTFAPTIIGAGTINQIAGVTFLAADDSTFTGATNVTGGALHVNGSLKNSAIAVSGGGTLAGNSMVGAVTVASGGIVAPGNSIGTLTVNGNYSAASGSIYNAEVDSAGHSDLLKVTGTASIASGAVLNITKIDAAAYAGGTKYTLLTAAGGVNGTYTVTGDVINSGFINTSVVYDANDVYLNVVQKASFSSVALTPNQKTVAAVVDALPGNSSLLTAMFTLPDGASARVALDKLSGEIHASARTALVEDSRFVREAALDRLAAPNVDHPVVWGQGFGDWGSNDGNGNAAGMNRSTKGFIGGVDLPVHQTWRVGVLGGFSNTGLNVQDRSSSGTSNNYHLGIYGGTEAGPVAVRVGATYSWSDLQTARAVAFGSLSDQLTAQYNGGTTQGFGEVGYKLDVGRVSLEPFANLAYVSLHTAAFKEAGGVSALSVSGDTTSTTFTTLGLHAREQVDLGISTIFTARGSLGWRHAFGDITPVSANAFAGGTTFNIDGVPVAQNAMAVDAGFDAAVSEHLTLGLSYTGQYASSARDNGVKANVGWRF